MPLAAKLFKLSETVKPEIALLKLKDFKIMWEDQETGQMLTEEIRDVSYSTGVLTANVLKDRAIVYRKRDELIKTVRTLEIPIFARLEDGVNQLLLVLAKKRIANEIAIDLSKIIYGRPSAVIEALLSHDRFRRYFETKMENARVVYFDQVDLPNVEVLALYGESLRDSSLYQEYLSHGKIWYVVVSLPERGDLVLGVTRNSVVTVFGRAMQEELIDYVFEELVQLLED